MTQLSNVGGGSVKIGGGGIKEGFNTFAKNHMAKGALGSKNLLSYTNMKDCILESHRLLDSNIASIDSGGVYLL